MVALRSELKILIATQPIDFRRGLHGLVALVAEAVAAEPWREIPPFVEAMGQFWMPYGFAGNRWQHGMGVPAPLTNERLKDACQHTAHAYALVKLIEFSGQFGSLRAR